MPDDRVTVFLPLTHYHLDFLNQAVESVFAQTRTDWHLLIVVNPDAQEHFRQLLADPLRDARVRLIPNQGKRLAGSYNSAMAAVETEFIAALMGDDLLEPEAIQVLGQEIRNHPESDFFHTGRYYIDENRRRISPDFLPVRPVTRDEFVIASPVKHLMCWRARRGLACGGVDEALEDFGSDDFDFPWTMFEHGARFTAVMRSLYVFRDHRQGFRLTTHVLRSVQIRTLRQILQKHKVEPRRIRQRVRIDRRTYMRQSLFRNPLDRWLRLRLGIPPSAGEGWREPYA